VRRRSRGRQPSRGGATGGGDVAGAEAVDGQARRSDGGPGEPAAGAAGGGMKSDGKRLERDCDERSGPGLTTGAVPEGAGGAVPDHSRRTSVYTVADAGAKTGPGVSAPGGPAQPLASWFGPNLPDRAGQGKRPNRTSQSSPNAGDLILARVDTHVGTGRLCLRTSSGRGVASAMTTIVGGRTAPGCPFAASNRATRLMI